MRLVAAARLLAHLESVQREPKKNGGVDGQHRRFMAVWPQPRVRKRSLLPDLRTGGHLVVPGDPQKDLLATKARSSQGVLRNQKSSWEGVLRNLKKKNRHKVEEKLKNAMPCDPTLDEADVGLLSCGFNYYCAESRDSYLGGVCVEAVNGSNQQARRLEDGSTGGFGSATATAADCDPTSPYFSQCDCTMFDTVSGDGYIQCLLYEDYCFVDCPSRCLDLNVGQQLTSNTTDSFTYCYSFFGSFEKEICYTSLENGCSISFDGITCNSCEPVSCNSPNTTYTEGIFAWDCTNAPGGTQGSYCNTNGYLIPALDFATNCTERNSTTPNLGWLGQIFNPARTTAQPPTFAPSPAATEQPPTFAPASVTVQPSNVAPASAMEQSPTFVPAPAPATLLSIADTVKGVTVIFSQANRLTENNVLVFEDTVELWFDAYYNSRRRHRQLLQRLLQQENSQTGIQNMRSQIDVTNQAVSNVSNTVTFSQGLIYDTAEIALSPLLNDLVLLPWKDIAYSNSLAEELKQELPEAFGALGTPITTPAIFAAVDVVNGEGDGSSKSLYALSLLALIPIAAVIGYTFHRQRSTRGHAHAVAEVQDRAESEPVSHPRDNEQNRPPEPQFRRDPSADLPSSVLAVAQGVETTEHLPEYKDQCRPVQGDALTVNTPLAAAVLMDQSNDK